MKLLIYLLFPVVFGFIFKINTIHTKKRFNLKESSDNMKIKDIENEKLKNTLKIFYYTLKDIHIMLNYTNNLLEDSVDMFKSIDELKLNETK